MDDRSAGFSSRQLQCTRLVASGLEASEIGCLVGSFDLTGKNRLRTVPTVLGLVKSIDIALWIDAYDYTLGQTPNAIGALGRSTPPRLRDLANPDVPPMGQSYNLDDIGGLRNGVAPPYPPEPAQPRPFPTREGDAERCGDRNPVGRHERADRGHGIVRRGQSLIKSWMARHPSSATPLPAGSEHHGPDHHPPQRCLKDRRASDRAGPRDRSGCPAKRAHASRPAGEDRAPMGLADRGTRGAGCSRHAHGAGLSTLQDHPDAQPVAGLCQGRKADQNLGRSNRRPRVHDRTGRAREPRCDPSARQMRMAGVRADRAVLRL